MPTSSTDLVRLDRHVTPADLTAAFAADVRRGLTADPLTSEPKWVPSKYLYDARGSDLFEAITRLPEYYPMRAEAAILTDHAAEIAAGAPEVDTLVELGSGASEKTRMLLDAFGATGRLRMYVPVDVSESALAGALDALRPDYPGLRLHAVAADFLQHLEVLPRTGTRLVAFLGGTIGNLWPAECADFLAAVRAGLEPGEAFLLGTDLVKDPARLVAAYDDAAGVTAEFELNLLTVLNRETGADFDPDAFAYEAVWDADRELIDMRLRARTDQVVHLREPELTVRFAAGEFLRTEISAKFRRATVERELAAAGLTLQSWWTDGAGDFALSLSTPTP